MGGMGGRMGGMGGMGGFGKQRGASTNKKTTFKFS